MCVLTGVPTIPGEIDKVHIKFFKGIATGMSKWNGRLALFYMYMVVLSNRSV